TVSLPGAAGKGEIQGFWLGEEINFVLQQFEVQLLGEGSFPRGKGLLTGKITWGKEGLGGKLSFQSDTLIFDRLSIETPRVEVEIKPGRAPVFLGKGSLFGGSIDVVGSFRDGNLFLKGKIQEMKPERFISLPITGTISGTLDIEAGKERKVIELALVEGELWWKDTILGTITGGTIGYRDGKLAGEAIVLKRGSGWIKGNIEVEGECFSGDLEAFDYPFTYRWGDWDVACLMQGKGHIAGSKKEWALDLSLFSSWTAGGKKGTFTLRGALKDKVLAVDEFLCDWKEGWVKLAGEVEMYRRVNLTGEISRLVVPTNQLGWSGELHSMHFVVRGPWQGVDFSCEAEGENFAIQGRPLGEGLTLWMEGTLPLPRNHTERMTLFQYFDPRYFRAGEIKVRGVRLSSLGIDFLRRYQGEGILDLVFHFESETQQWSFKSEGFSLIFPGYLNFKGKMAGVYDGEKLGIDQLFLEDTEKHFAVRGQGKLGVKEKTLDFRLQGEMDTAFPLKDSRWFFHGKGQGEIIIAGTTESPLVRGEITITQGEIFREHQKYVSFTNVQAELAEGLVRILSARGTVEGMVVN
ncbi:MAG: hypothetical protein N2Z84_03770, partial [Atribacterota bacterium]|nr:hypothetical protein [Atribacterota bacterium]